MSTDRDRWTVAMEAAIDEARLSIAEGNPPFGAVLVDEAGTIVTTGHNTERSDLDPAGHAEVNLLRDAAQTLGAITFNGFTMVGNAEPCSMCASLAIKRGIRQFVYGAPAEASMNPYLPLRAVAAASHEPIEIVAEVMATECAAVVAEGRAALHKPDTQSE